MLVLTVFVFYKYLTFTSRSNVRGLQGTEPNTYNGGRRMSVDGIRRRWQRVAETLVS